MKKIIVLIAIVCINLTSCKSQKEISKLEALDGTWELSYITGPRIAFEGLYPDKKPTIVFDIANNKVAGNNSCNQYFGALLIDGDKINFKDAKLGMTMMACEGSGDSVYMSTLEKIETYTITDDGKTLNFLTGNIVMMHFKLLK